ncbi:MAG: leucine-rich repeat protein [Bacteroidales bacterium]|nr:leucine-rich repeat protein [Bacteroidales bacterium]
MQGIKACLIGSITSILCFACSKEQPEIVIEITEPTVATINGLEYTFYTDHTAQLNVQQHELISEVEIPMYVKFQGIEYEVTRIVDNALKGHDEVKFLRLNCKAPSVGNSVFSDMTSLKKVIYNIVDHEANYVYTDYLYREPTFDGTNNIESIDFGSDVRSTIPFFFRSTKNVKKIVIPDNVEGIGNDTFVGMSDLEEVTLGKGIKHIWFAAFGRCIKLKTVNYNCEDCIVPDHYHNSYYFPFGENTTNLSVLNIGSDVKNIPSVLFSSVTSFEVIKISAKIPPTCDHTNNFNTRVKQKATLYVPSASLQAYKTDAVWGQFGKIVAE